MAEFQAQFRHSLKDAPAAFRMAIAGQRWQKLVPLTDAEMLRVNDLIHETRLELLRAVRCAGDERMGFE